MGKRPHISAQELDVIEDLTADTFLACQGPPIADHNYIVGLFNGVGHAVFYLPEQMPVLEALRQSGVLSTLEPLDEGRVYFEFSREGAESIADSFTVGLARDGATFDQESDYERPSHRS